MSREIKFRAWDLDNKKMGEVKDLQFDYNCVVSTAHEYRRAIGREAILMQFTGLLDKNGKEVYEGDVVKCHTTKPFVTQIVWELCGFRLKDTLLGNLNKGWGKELEIVGNVYENPELLDGV